MKMQMYNVVWYDGVDAYVSKYVLPQDEKSARNDLQRYWNTLGCEGEILKLHCLYGVSFENIIALRNGNEEQVRTFTRFEEMYF